MNLHNSVTSRVPADLSNKRAGGAGGTWARASGRCRVETVDRRETEPLFRFPLRVENRSSAKKVQDCRHPGGTLALISD